MNLEEMTVRFQQENNECEYGFIADAEKETDLQEYWSNSYYDECIRNTKDKFNMSVKNMLFYNKNVNMTNNLDSLFVKVCFVDENSEIHFDVHEIEHYDIVLNNEKIILCNNDIITTSVGDFIKEKINNRKRILSLSRDIVDRQKSFYCSRVGSCFIMIKFIPYTSLYTETEYNKYI
jgi:hypothetical protein